MTIDFVARFLDVLVISISMKLPITVATKLSILSRSLQTLSDFKLSSLYNLASEENQKQTAVCLMDIEGVNEKKFVTVSSVSFQYARELLLFYTQSFATLYSHLKLQMRGTDEVLV